MCLKEDGAEEGFPLWVAEMVVFGAVFGDA